MPLMGRDEFRTAVFARDNGRCVICNAEGQDAHHIMERRLFPDGGYYIDNGATLCGKCHLLAESTQISAAQIRDAAKINTRVIPLHLYPDQAYDKWGNPMLQNGTRLRGELFDDESVQKVLAPVLGCFTKYVKYPRTYHLPWSPGITSDDRAWTKDTMLWHNEAQLEMVVTEKLDGENTTMYNDYIHARSLEYEPHESRNRVKALHASLAHEIPEGWRLCGENVYARHSIPYDKLPGFFILFGIWNEKNICLSWDETVEWGKLLGLPTPSLIYRGRWDEETFKAPMLAAARKGMTTIEGFVVRTAAQFHYKEFPRKVGKFVRPNHVQTHGHWIRQRVVPNQLA